MATCAFCAERFANAMQLGAHIRVCTSSNDNNIIITEPVQYSLQDMARRPAQPWGEPRTVTIVRPAMCPTSTTLSRDYREVRIYPPMYISAMNILWICTHLMTFYDKFTNILCSCNLAGVGMLLQHTSAAATSSGLCLTQSGTHL